MCAIHFVCTFRVNGSFFPLKCTSPAIDRLSFLVGRLCCCYFCCCAKQEWEETKTERETETETKMIVYIGELYQFSKCMAKCFDQAPTYIMKQLYHCILYLGISVRHNKYNVIQ